MTHTPNTAVITAFYPGVEPYLGDFFASLNAQTVNTPFDLVAVNDGCSGLAEHTPRQLRCKVHALSCSGSPTENRVYAMRWAREAGYRNLIFCDADDVMQDNRVSVSEQLLADYEIVITDLDLWDGNQVFEADFISRRLGAWRRVSLADIVDYNFIGFSNTAIQSSCVSKFKVSFGREVLAGDWLFYSTLLREGCLGVFSNATRTLYRRHPDNQTCLQPQTFDQVKEVLRVRNIHYQHLANHYHDFQERAARAYAEWQRISEPRAAAEWDCSSSGQLSGSGEGDGSRFWWELNDMSTPAPSCKREED